MAPDGAGWNRLPCEARRHGLRARLNPSKAMHMDYIPGVLLVIGAVVFGAGRGWASTGHSPKAIPTRDSSCWRSLARETSWAAGGTVTHQAELRRQASPVFAHRFSIQVVREQRPASLPTEGTPRCALAQRDHESAALGP